MLFPKVTYDCNCCTICVLSQECALVTTQYQTYRAEQARERVEIGCNEVCQATLSLFAEGMNPSTQQVTRKLSDPDVMCTPEGLATWHTARRELGLEP